MAKMGDLVEVKTKDQTLTGFLIPSQELSGIKTTLIKLSSGYNVGIPTSEIESIEVIESNIQKEKKSKELKFDKSLPTVSILSTGGTISSKIDYRTGGVSAAITASDLLDAMPELEGGVNLKTRAVMNVMSEDMTPGLWVNLANEVAKELNEGVDGVVVTHGTDTMHYSTAALSFLLNNLKKPVVFTGSQRSTDRGSSDGFMNLSCAVNLAKSNFSGVALVMHGEMDDTYCYAHKGVRVRKMHTSRRDAFKSINSEPIAKISHDGKISYNGEHSLRGAGDVSVNGGLNEKVGFIKAFPGMPPSLLDFYIDGGYQAIVFEGTALGHLPVSDSVYSLLPQIDRAIDNGILLAMTTQCLYGRVHPNVYSNLRELSSRGVVFCGDMLPETCYVKTMWVLSQSKSIKEAKELLLSSKAGELSEKSLIL